MNHPINKPMDHHESHEKHNVYISEEDYSFMYSKFVHLAISITILIIFGVSLVTFFCVYYLYPKPLVTSLSDIFKQEWNYKLQNSPFFAIYNKFPGNFSSKVDNYTVMAFQDREDWYSGFYNYSSHYLNRGKNELESVDYYNALIFYETIYNKLKLLEYNSYLLNLDQTKGFHMDLIDYIIPEHLETLEEFENYLFILGKIPDLINQQIELFRYANSLNYKNPSVIMKNVPYQIQYLISNNETFLHSFHE